MTSQTGQEMIRIHKLSNISRSKGNQAMNFGQLIRYNVRNTFLQNHPENVTGRLFPDVFFFFKKRFNKIKAKWSAH